MKYFVYLIISINKKKIYSYVGYTKNLEQRLTLHNTGRGAKYTRGRKWTLAYKKCYKNKIDAMKQEYILKKDIKKRMFIKNSFLKSN